MTPSEMELRDRAWAKRILRNRPALDAIISAMRAGDMEAFEDIEYLTWCHNELGYPCAPEMTPAQKFAFYKSATERLHNPTVAY